MNISHFIGFLWIELFVIPDQKAYEDCPGYSEFSAVGGSGAPRSVNWKNCTARLEFRSHAASLQRNKRCYLIYKLFDGDLELLLHLHFYISY